MEAMGTPGNLIPPSTKPHIQWLAKISVKLSILKLETA